MTKDEIIAWAAQEIICESVNEVNWRIFVSKTEENNKKKTPEASIRS